MWGYDNIGSIQYVSIGIIVVIPFSEPETQGIRDFILSRKFTDSSLFIVIGMLCIYLGDIKNSSPDYDDIEILLLKLATQ